jgi:type I restriction enzyme, S subunit
MASEWHEAALGDVIELKRGFDLPQQDRVKGNIPIISSSGISDYQSVAKVKGPGVVTGRYGTIGDVFFVRGDFWPLNTTLYVLDFKGNDPRFVSYLLRTVDFLAYSDKAAVPGVNRNHLHLARVFVPNEISEQQAIARVLGTLDDKIELNRQMNQTLEGMARALFKSWFLDFDPVRAKAEGRNPSLPKPLADHFPASFKGSDVGKIPVTWSVKTAGEVSERIAMGPFGSSIKVETFVDAGIPIISGQHLHSFMLSDTTFNFISEEHANRLINALVKRGDVVFTHAGNIGQVAFIPDDSRYQRYVISQRQFYMRCDLDQVSPSFVAFYFSSEQGQHRLLANTSSSGVPSIARPVSYLRSVQLPIPPRDALIEFDRLIQPMLRRFRLNRKESDTLSNIRDALLRRLVSGELRIPDAERIVGEQV